jgi:hypothetical protein
VERGGREWKGRLEVELTRVRERRGMHSLERIQTVRVNCGGGQTGEPGEGIRVEIRDRAPTV